MLAYSAQYVKLLQVRKFTLMIQELLIELTGGVTILYNSAPMLVISTGLILLMSTIFLQKRSGLTVILWVIRPGLL